jgi:lipopolysaccharide transport system permease protein
MMLSPYSEPRELSGKAERSSRMIMPGALVPNSMREGVRDWREGALQWRVWHLMGTAELRRRYARSRIGQFWLTISTGVFVVALGVVWALLWNLPVANMLPYIAVSHIVWLFMTGVLGEATQAFLKTGAYFFNQKMSFSVAIYALGYRHVLILVHNVIIIAGVFLFFWHPLTWTALLAMPGWLLMAATAMSAAYVIAIIGTRYRDIAQIVENVLQIAFFLTPVLWKAEFLTPDYRWVVEFNPFAIFLSLVRDPLLGIPVPAERWLAAAAITLLGFLVALPFVGRYHKRIVFWL